MSQERVADVTLKETDDYKFFVMRHIDRIGESARDIKEYMNNIECLDDMLDAYKDETYEKDLAEIEKDLNNAQLKDEFGRVIRAKESQLVINNARAKYRALHRLMLRRRFTPLGGIDIDML